MTRRVLSLCALTVLLAAPSARALSCGSFDIVRRIHDYDLAFVGTVVDEPRTELWMGTWQSLRLITVEVEEVWKQDGAPWRPHGTETLLVDPDGMTPRPITEGRRLSMWSDAYMYGGLERGERYAILSNMNNAYRAPMVEECGELRIDADAVVDSMRNALRASARLYNSASPGNPREGLAVLEPWWRSAPRAGVAAGAVALLALAFGAASRMAPARSR